jgi:hypothetical protein
MTPKALLRFSVAAVVSLTTSAYAQSVRTEELAQQWRASRLADLTAERARIDAEIAALPTSSPSMVPTPSASVGRAPQATPVTVVTAATSPSEGAASKKDAAAEAEPASAPAEGRQTFGGLDLGVGLSFTMDVGKIDRISRASVVNGVVRTDDQDNGRARIMLESHYFFTPCTWNFLGLKNPCSTVDGYRVADPKVARWGVGPFIAIQPGSDNIIDAIGMGLMVGARREQSAQSFNLGIGVVFDPNTRVLGDGIRANEPLPSGETDIRYRETLQTGLLVLTSFSF